MIATCVQIRVKEENIDDFIQATIKNHEGTIKEPGNIRFDVLQRTDDPSQFTLYEVFEFAEAINAHKETQHYLAWKNTVSDWMAESRVGLKHQVLRPLERSQW